jgi:hypothetical protein
LTFGATEGGTADGVSVIVASAVQRSEGLPTSTVGWARLTAPIATKTPTPSAAESAFQLPRRRWKFVGFINLSFIECSRYAEVVLAVAPGVGCSGPIATDDPLAKLFS